MKIVIVPYSFKVIRDSDKRDVRLIGKLICKPISENDKLNSKYKQLFPGRKSQRN